MSKKKKINLELIKYISLTLLNYVAGSACREAWLEKEMKKYRAAMA